MEGKSLGRLAIALYSNVPEMSSELPFRKGDILTVIEFDHKNQTGWWLCSMRGDRGICPGNYLQLIDEDKYTTLSKYNKGFKSEECLSLEKPNKTETILSKEAVNELFDYDIPRTSSITNNLNIPPLLNPSSLIRSHKTESDLSLNSAGSSNRVSTASSFQSSSNDSTTSSSNFNLITNCSNKSTEAVYANEIEPEFEYDVPKPSLTTICNEISKLGSSSTNLIDNSVLNEDKKTEQRLQQALSSLNLQNKANSQSHLVSNRSNLSLNMSSFDPEAYDIPKSSNTKRISGQSLIEEKYDHVRPLLSKRSSSLSVSSTSSSNDYYNFGVVLRNKNVTRDEIECSSLNYDIPKSKTSWSDDGSYKVLANNFKRQVSVCSSSSLQDDFLNRQSFRNSGHFCHNSRSSSQSEMLETKIIPLSPQSAVSVIEKYKEEVLNAIKGILSFVKPKWRLRENLTEIMPHLRFGCIRLNLAIKDFSEFCYRTVGNAKRLSLDAILIRLQKLLQPLKSAVGIIQNDVDELEACSWSVERLSVSSSEEGGSDALEQLLLCGKNLQYDVTEIFNFISLHSKTLFSTPTSNPHQEEDKELKAAETNSPDEDYDYVELSSSSTPKPPQIPPHPSSKNILKTDSELLELYSAQIANIAPLLSQSISTVLSAVSQNEIPRVFNAHLKYVILLSYKILFIADTLSRNLSPSSLVKSIENSADGLHKAIIRLHEGSKVAEREFPKVLPVQNVVDRIWETTGAATEIKKIIFNATN